MNADRAAMKVILFGATGMVGQGVLRECLLDAGVESVLAIGRSPTGQRHAKLREIVHDDFLDYSAIESELTGYDACFFCLGVSSVGMNEERYRHLTYDITLAAARRLRNSIRRWCSSMSPAAAPTRPNSGSLMWARVKGKTENDLLKLPFKAAYMFRPAGIQPLHGIRSKTGWVQAIYVGTAPLLSLLNRLAPKYMTTTEQVGRAMIGWRGTAFQGRCWRARISTRSNRLRVASFRGARSLEPGISW